LVKVAIIEHGTKRCKRNNARIATTIHARMSFKSVLAKQIASLTMSTKIVGKNLSNSPDEVGIDKCDGRFSRN
jgi:hypothetical protein